MNLHQGEVEFGGPVKDPLKYSRSLKFLLDVLGYNVA